MHQQGCSPLANTTGAHSPVFSPDGRWIAFAQQGKLKKVSVQGGPAQTICDASQPRGVHWGTNGEIAYAPTRRSGVWLVSANGRKPEKVTDLGPDSGPASHRWPHILPDGRTILFTHTDNEDDFTSARVEAVSVETRQSKVLLNGAMYARYVPTGHLVFVRGRVLMAVEFDPVRAVIIGSEIPVLEELTTDLSMGTGQYSFSDNGVLVYVPGYRNPGLIKLVWVDRKGKATPASQHYRGGLGFSVSPDGSQIAWVLRGTVGSIPPDIWVLETKRDMLTRLTFDDGVEQYPLWSPDSTWIYFSSDRDQGVAAIYRRKADGSGAAERLTEAENDQRAESVSPDGHTIVLQESLQSGGELMLLQMVKERTVEPFLETPFTEQHPSTTTLTSWPLAGTDVFQPYPDSV